MSLWHSSGPGCGPANENQCHHLQSSRRSALTGTNSSALAPSSFRKRSSERFNAPHGPASEYFVTAHTVSLPLLHGAGSVLEVRGPADLHVLHERTEAEKSTAGKMDPGKSILTCTGRHESRRKSTYILVTAPCSALPPTFDLLLLPTCIRLSCMNLLNDYCQLESTFSRKVPEPGKLIGIWDM